MSGITVVIPTHLARVRNGMTKRAIGSVLGQTLPAESVVVEHDLTHAGAPATRDRGLQKVVTPWTAFLDSDDQLKPIHLERLMECAIETGADYVYAWYEAVGFGADPLPHFGRRFDPERPTQTTITILVRTELAQSVGFRQPPEGALINGERYGEDFQFTVECVKAGARIEHLPERTWLWNLHGANTSGDPDRGDARTR
ncbi:glycosyltransferase family 2 protein [Streptomyces malaysiensis]|uniref:Glycosyltransferase n=1 Tax=Streptomyces malaysiensis subsp. samsunensis TaxID=459658 RepID=A0A9X2RUY7_STRMQ|nr:glycosyltransferase [Streptomyces samsunensis]MCQ8831747.1 glycosyltransferase [Streptomyces samsunensis]